MNTSSELSLNTDTTQDPIILTHQKMISRWRAGAIHLALSAVFVGLVLLLTLLFWSPLPYFWVSGACFIVLLLASIDLCLGPVLTTFIFKAGKKRLKLDLTIIAAVQIAALIYGAHTLYDGRIAYMVFTGESFVMVRASDMDVNALKNAKAEYQTNPFSFKWVSVTHEAQTAQTKNGAKDPEMFGAYLYPKYYETLESNRQDLIAANMSKNTLLSLYPEQKSKIEQIVDKYVDGLFFVIQGSTGVGLVVLDKISLKPLASCILQRY
jgi:hypothetical protein